MSFDLLIQNGHVIDPAAGLNAVRDIAVTGGRVAALLEPGHGQTAGQTLNAAGLFVVPGLIDFHVHVFPGVSHFGIDADATCLARGVTTVLDFGTAGELIFDGFRRFVIDQSRTRVFALLHIASQGLISSPGVTPALGELHDLRYLDIPGLERCVERHRDRITGIKLRLTANLAENGRNEAEALRIAREGADRVGLPLVIHSPNSSLSSEHVLSHMKAGDVLTHCFHAKQCGLVDEKLKVLPIVRDKLAEGVLLDVGHGAGSFGFHVARALLDQDILPHFISSDLHVYNLQGPVHDLLTTLDKFVHLGMPLPDVIARATALPAKFLGLAGDLGTLQPGALADITILENQTGEFPLCDTEGRTETAARRLEVRYVFRSGVRQGLLPRPGAAL